MHIEPATQGDLSELEALEAECFERPLAFTRRHLRRLMSNPRAGIYVLRRGGRIVAEAVILRRKTTRGTVARIYSMAVQARERKQGLGRAMLAACLDVLRAEQAAAVVLEVDVRNHAAIALYEKAGFTKTRRLRDYYAPGKDGWKMRLQLRQ